MDIGRSVDRLTEFQVANVPVGAGVYYIAIKQVADFVSDLISSFVPVPPVVSGAAAAWLLRLPQVERILGQYGSYYASMAAVGSAIDQQFHLSQMVASLFGKVESEFTHKKLSGFDDSLGMLPEAPITESVPVETNNIDSDIYEEYMQQYKD